MVTVNKRLENLKDFFSTRFEQHISIDYQTCQITFLCNENEIYKPSQTELAFHKDKSLVKLIRGPFGSGKTLTNCMEIILNACQMPRCKDGIRYARTLVFRNTFDQLKKGAFDTWSQWCGRLGRSHPLRGNELSYHHLFNDGYGLINLEIWFIAFEKVTDPDKFKSYNATNAFINELDGIPEIILEYLPARLGRYPKKSFIDHKDIKEHYKLPIMLSNGQKIEQTPYWHGIGADCNSFDTRHYLYYHLEKAKTDDFKQFSQPAGLLVDKSGKYLPNPKCDNYGIGISEDYYLSLAKNKTHEYIDVFILNKYGKYIQGEKVYPQYNDNLHSVPSINYDPNFPLLLQLDGGFTPACLISQFVNGQMRDIKEFCTTRMYLEELMEMIVKPYLANSGLQNYPIELIGDPAITEREVEALKNLGFILEKALTNKIEARIQAVVELLNKNVMGEGSTISSREGCPELVAGFRADYTFKEYRTMEKNKHEKIPQKSHPVSDIHDCKQYGALHFTSFMVRKGKLIDGKAFINQERY